MSAIESSGKKNYKFGTWARTHSCHPELYFEPENAKQIKQIVALARARSKTVKIAGFGHSFSDLVCTCDYLINMKRLNKVLEVNKEDRIVKIEGGVSDVILTEELARQGLALSVQGSCSGQTMAGMLSTGTHGTGLNYGTIAFYVLELELLTASGEVLTLSRTQSRDIFLASLIGLGSLGIILSMTVQCEPAYRLRQAQHTLSLQDVLENLNVFLKASEHFRFTYYPHTDDCIVYHMNRTKQPTQRKTSWFWDELVGFYFLQFLYWISTFVPSLIPRINQSYLKLNGSHQELTDRSDRVFNVDSHFKHVIMEWAVPREKTAEVLVELKSWIENSQFKAHFPIEVRFVKRDDIFLSPAYGTDMCYINIISYRPYGKSVSHSQYWKAFGDIALKAGGRPHWATDHGLTGQHFKEMYPKWEEFCSIRKKLDPFGMFLNEGLQGIFADTKFGCRNKA